MKQKIFFICSGLYDQSKVISVDLKHLDKKVRDLKHQMTHLLLKRNPDMRPDEIDKIFSRYDNKEVSTTLDKAKEKCQTAELSQLLGQKIGIKPEEEVKAVEKPRSIA